MSKITDAAKAAIVAVFENGDVPDGTNFSTLIEAIQEAAQDHEHSASGGEGSGTGDALRVAYPDGISGMFLDGALSPMLLTGGAIVDGTNAGTFKVEALTAILRASTDADGVLTVVEKEEEDNITLTDPDTAYKVILQYDGGSPAIAIQTGAPNETTDIAIGSAMRDASNNRWHQCGGLRLADGVRKLHKRAAKLRSLELCWGSAISDEGSRNFEMTTGYVYGGANEFTLDAYASLGDKFTLAHYGGAVPEWTFVADQTAIPNDQYNDYGANPSLVNLANNEYGCFWVYALPCNGQVYAVYGRGSYKLAEAEQAQPPAELPVLLSSFGVLIGCITIQEAGSTFTTIQMVTDRFFTGTAAADHGAQAGLLDNDHPQYAFGYIEYRILAPDTDTAIDTGVGGEFRCPQALTVVGVGAYVDNAGAGSVTTIDINEEGTSILSTKITIDDAEKTSEDAETPAVISDSALAADAIITFDVDGIGSGTAAKGLTVWMKVLLVDA